MVANQFLEAINSGLNANVPLLSPEEILYAAGIQPVPEPGTMVLAAAGLLALGAMVIRRRVAKA